MERYRDRKEGREGEKSKQRSTTASNEEECSPASAMASAVQQYSIVDLEKGGTMAELLQSILSLEKGRKLEGSIFLYTKPLSFSFSFFKKNFAHFGSAR